MNGNEIQKDIQSTVHDLDKRVSVLETRADNQAEVIQQIRSDVGETKSLSMRILNDMHSHSIEEANERSKMFRWIITTLVGVSISVILMLFGVIL